MKRISLLALVMWLLATAAGCLTARDRYYARGHGDNYRYDRNYYIHSERGVLREIRRNEARIARLERKLERLLDRGYRHEYRHRAGRDWRIRELEREIRRLQARNHYLRSLLYRRW